MNIFNMLKIIAGFILIIFLPGFLMSLIIIPSGKAMNWMERILLSLGLSMALVPLVLFFVNMAGIKITPLSVSISVCAIITIEVFYLSTKFYFKKPKI